MVFKCDACPKIFSNNRDFIKHKNKKYPCYQQKFTCDCGARYTNKPSLHDHKKTCQGKKPTIDEKEAEITNLKLALAASSGLNHEIQNKNDAINNGQVHSGTGDNIATQINNVTNNIFVLPAGQENVEHIKKMPFELLKTKLGMKACPATNIEAYKMVHLDMDHPENHNILLPEKDGKHVHFYAPDNTWKTGLYEQHVRFAIDDDNRLLTSLIRNNENCKELWNYLVYDVQRKVGEIDDHGLKEILEGIREPLHTSTKRLIELHNEKDGSLLECFPNLADNEKEQASKLLFQIEKTKQIQIEADAGIRREKEKTKQLQLQIELAKLTQK